MTIALFIAACAICLCIAMLGHAQSPPKEKRPRHRGRFKPLVKRRH